MAAALMLSLANADAALVSVGFARCDENERYGSAVPGWLDEAESAPSFHRNRATR
jgi:hypothetical protein